MDSCRLRRSSAACGWVRSPLAAWLAHRLVTMSETPEPSGSVKRLAAQLRDFAEARDWDQFHTPKNLAMALVAEAGELAALFQWLTPEQSSSIVASAESRLKVQDELADVFIYL